jgi:hypothetical protein
MGLFDRFVGPGSKEKNRARLKHRKAHVRLKGIAGLRELDWKGLSYYDPDTLRKIGYKDVEIRELQALRVALGINDLAVTDPDLQVRKEAEAAFVELISPLFTDRDILSEHRCQIVRAMKEAPGSAVNEVLLHALETQAPDFHDVRLTGELIDALGNRGESRAAAFLQQTIDCDRRMGTRNFGEKANNAIKKIEGAYGEVDILLDDIENAWKNHQG